MNMRILEVVVGRTLVHAVSLSLGGVVGDPR